MLEPIHDSGLEQLKTELSKYPRMDGYYHLDLVSVAVLRQANNAQNDILTALYERWAPHDARAAYQIAHPPIQPFIPSEESSGYEDYESTIEDALEALTYELKGGSGIGHLADTVPSEKAAELTARFFALFQGPRAYRGLGWGNPFYAFEQGVVLVDDERAGCFMIIEND